MQAKIQSESGLSLAEKRALLASLLQEESAPSRVYPSSFGQRRLWILDQLEGETPAYNLPVGVRLFGPLDLPALERSLSIIVGRHESLRTVFQVENGEPVQVVSAQLEAT